MRVNIFALVFQRLAAKIKKKKDDEPWPLLVSTVGCVKGPHIVLITSNERGALAGRLSGLEHRPGHQKVVGSIPSQCEYVRQLMDVSLSPPSSLKNQ